MLADPGRDVLEARSGGEDCADTEVEQGLDVTPGDIAAQQDERLQAGPPQLLHQAGGDRQVSAGKDREADDRYILLQRRLDDLLDRLMQPGVDDLEPGLPQRQGHDACAAVVPVEAGLGDQDTRRSVHPGSHRYPTPNSLAMMVRRISEVPPP